MDPDTDAGGLDDGHEIFVGKNPLNPTDDIYIYGENCRVSQTLGLWLDPENTGRIEKSMFVSTVEPYKGDLSSKSNYDYRSASTHPVRGPVPEQDKMKVALYEGSDGLSLMFFANKDNVRDEKWQRTEFDIHIRKNRGKDRVLISDDGSEVKLVKSTRGLKSYRALLRYKNNSDGGVIGPLTTKRFQAHFSMKSTNDITDLVFVSGDGNTIPIDDNGPTNFIIGNRSTVDCQMDKSKMYFGC